MDMRDSILNSMPLITSLFFGDQNESIEQAMLRVLEEHFQFQSRDVVPMYSNIDFKNNFRVNKSTFEVLFGKICVFGEVIRAGRPSISIEKQLLCVLWYLASQESYRSVADRFHVSESTLHRMVDRICHILVKMAPSIIHWPNISDVKNEFESICGFPDVVGAVDVTHINIKAPTKHPGCYINRQGNYSITLQAVCTPNLAFTDIFCSFPGSVEDARVLRNSLVQTEMFDNEKYFPNNSHLVGDSSFPLHTNLMVPYKDNGCLTTRQMNFNRKLSETRICVEKAFDQLKDRFRRLKFFDVEKVEMVPLYALAACVLHNVCIKEEDFVGDSEESAMEEDSPDEEEVSTTEATKLPLPMMAVDKRDFICHLLNQKDIL